MDSDQGEKSRIDDGKTPGKHLPLGHVNKGNVDTSVIVTKPSWESC